MGVPAPTFTLTTSSTTCPAAPVLALPAQRRLMLLWLLLSDAAALGAALLAAYWLRFDLQLTTAPEVVPLRFFYQTIAAMLVTVSLTVFVGFKLYDPERLLGGVSEYSRILNACSTSTMLLIFVTFLVPAFTISRFWVLSSWILSFLFVAANRFVSRRLVYFLRSRGYLLSPALIIGTNEEALTLAAELGHWRSSGLRLCGYVATNVETGVRLRLPVLGSVRDIDRIVREHDIHELVVAITAVEREELLQLCEDVNPIPEVHLRLSSGVYELLTTGLTVQTKGTVPLISLNKVRLAPEEAGVKTLLEYTLAFFGLLVVSPLLLLIAAAVKLDSRGPVLHRRRVLGVNGKTFDAFKFRTMHVNGDELLRQRPDLAAQLKDIHKLREDPRVTRVGRFLRRYSLDELPQLLNVLLGQMGLVGPRMITAEEGDKYGPYRMNLLTVKPGITGLWQVSGRSDLSYAERVNLDMYYVRNYSVWLDLQILFVQTLPAVLKGRGAY
jgi:exopolysaccharide biosynthesis polyprenyl glycosylphosphotransferase